jgi:hypothetical protein
MHRRLGRSQVQSGLVRKNSPQPEFEPRIPATSELLYRLRTPVHRIQKRGKENIQWKPRSKKRKRNRKRKKKIIKTEKGEEIRAWPFVSQALSTVYYITC